MTAAAANILFLTAGMDQQACIDDFLTFDALSLVHTLEIFVYQFHHNASMVTREEIKQQQHSSHGA